MITNSKTPTTADPIKWMHDVKVLYPSIDSIATVFDKDGKTHVCEFRLGWPACDTAVKLLKEGAEFVGFIAYGPHDIESLAIGKSEEESYKHRDYLNALTAKMAAASPFSPPSNN